MNMRRQENRKGIERVQSNCVTYESGVVASPTNLHVNKQSGREMTERYESILFCRALEALRFGKVMSAGLKVLTDCLTTLRFFEWNMLIFPTTRPISRTISCVRHE